jgi:Zn-dependent M16 (insulinase) family peptidase
MMKKLRSFVLIFVFLFVSIIHAQNYLDNLSPGQSVHGFKILYLYEDGTEGTMGARFVSEEFGFIVDLLQIQSVPQAFFWIKTPPTSSKGEPHACEHLLLGKGNRGRYVSALEDMTLSSSTAYTDQIRTCYHFNTISGEKTFFRIFEAKLQAFLHPDFTDEEIRREVCHIGIVEDPKTGELSIDEKGTVYTEMVSALEKPWYYNYDTLNRLVYGKEHPLSYNSGGSPDVMRSMVPEDMWTFHRDTHHLSNMGAIISIPAEIAIDTFLKEMSVILERSQDFEEEFESTSIRVQNLPPPQMEEIGTVKLATYPSENLEDPGYILMAWPATLKLTNEEEIMLDLFLETFSSGSTSNLYNLFINSQTRKIDIGGNSVYGGYDDSLDVSIYLGITGVRNKVINEETIHKVKKILSEELQRIRSFADNSEELAEFNDRARSRLVQNKKQIFNYLNSPPMFGFRSFAASGWVNLLLSVEKQTGNRRSLVLKDMFAFAENQLNHKENIWKESIDKWQLLKTLPYVVGTTPDPTILKRAAEAKKIRLAEYLKEFKKKYDTDDSQQAITKYKEEFDAQTAEMEELKSRDKLPEFIDNPPLTLDDQLQYERIKLGDNIELVASTFDVMTSSTVALAFRMDVVPEEFFIYLPFLPDVMTDIGVIKDGEVVPYDKMRERLRREVLGLSAGYDVSFDRERIELVLTGQGSSVGELRNALDWMEAALFTPYLSVENLPRMRDVVDQSLISYRNRMKGSEERWVGNPASAFRMQHNPLYLATSSFLTETHYLQRLKWMLTGAGEGPEQEKLSVFLEKLEEFGQQKSRSELTALLESLEKEESSDEMGIKKVMAEMEESSHKTAVEILRAIKTILGDIPDANLSHDWSYLCKQTRDDLIVKPDKVIEDIKRLLLLFKKSDNVRMVMISNSSDRKSVLDDIQQLLAKLDSETPSQRQAYAKKDRIVERLRSRQPGLEKPVYVGLMFEGTRNGVLIFSARVAEEYDTEEESLLTGLAGKIFSGGGPHSFFMNTWAAGLAYSNGYRISQRNGFANYYAERCPDVAETMRFVVGLIKSAEHNPALADYAIAQVFGASRAPSRYEARGTAMASDLVDGFLPEKVKTYREKVLSLKARDNLYEDLTTRMEQAYGPVLIGYGKPLAESKEGTFFLIGPEPQFVSLENYIRSVEGEQTVFRLYPRDFWIAD